MASVHVSPPPLRTSLAKYSLVTSALEPARNTTTTASKGVPIGPIRREASANATATNRAGNGQSRMAWWTDPPAPFASSISIQATGMAINEKAIGLRAGGMQGKGGSTDA